MLHAFKYPVSWVWAGNGPPLYLGTFLSTGRGTKFAVAAERHMVLSVFCWVFKISHSTRSLKLWSPLQFSNFQFSSLSFIGRCCVLLSIKHMSQSLLQCVYQWYERRYLDTNMHHVDMWREFSFCRSHFHRCGLNASSATSLRHLFGDALCTGYHWGFVIVVDKW